MASSKGRRELIGEVDDPTRRALAAKLGVYRRCGVRECIVWRVEDRAVDWFVLRDEKYERLEPGPDGVTRSEVFPGLWLDAAAPAREQLPRVMDVLRQGIESPEHAAFVARLAGL